MTIVSVTSHKLRPCRAGIRMCLPAGFGSGWDNFRGVPGHINVSRPSAAGEVRERDNRRRQILSALQRKPLEPCRLPNEVHCGMSAASGAPSLEAQTVMLKGSSASVTAFSPNGLLLAVAVEEAPKKWSVKVCAVQQAATQHAVSCCHVAKCVLFSATMHCASSRAYYTTFSCEFHGTQICSQMLID
jgi:hypothetical protein